MHGPNGNHSFYTNKSSNFELYYASGGPTEINQVIPWNNNIWYSQVSWNTYINPNAHWLWNTESDNTYMLQFEFDFSKVADILNTICPTQSPTSSPSNTDAPSSEPTTASPISEPSHHPSMSPTTLTTTDEVTAPQTNMKNRGASNKYEYGVDIKITVKYNVTSNVTDEKVVDSLANTTRTTLRGIEKEEHCVAPEDDYNISVSMRGSKSSVITASLFVCDEDAQSLLITDIDANLAREFIDNVDKSILSVNPNGIQVEADRISPELEVSLSTTTTTNKPNQIKAALKSSDDDPFWVIVGSVIGILCICGLMLTERPLIQEKFYLLQPEFHLD